ncbi:MAG TPA: hypothetical protein VKE40_22955 [Gemmataceae bacterium]|nr:hypothetical protein [Gemmataceae bacterium]
MNNGSVRHTIPAFDALITAVGCLELSWLLAKPMRHAIPERRS